MAIMRGVREVWCGIDDGEDDREVNSRIIITTIDS
jgi:hypothetical protein